MLGRIFDRNRVILNEYINLTFRRHSNLLTNSQRLMCEEELRQIRINATRSSLGDAVCTTRMYDYGIEVMESVGEEELAGMAKEKQLEIVNIVVSSLFADDEFRKEQWRQVAREDRVAFFYELVMNGL